MNRRSNLAEERGGVEVAEMAAVLACGRDQRRTFEPESIWCVLTLGRDGQQVELLPSRPEGTAAYWTVATEPPYLIERRHDDIVLRGHFIDSFGSCRAQSPESGSSGGKEGSAA